MRRISILFLLALASCDSAVPTEPLPTVRLVAPLPDLDLDLTDATKSIRLDTHFVGDEAAGDVAYAVRVVSGEAGEFEVEGAVLTVRPLSEGRAEVRVEARGARGGMAADTFAVAVADPCPASPPPDASVVLPVSVGQRWVYALSTYNNPSVDSYEYRSSGSVEVEVVAAGPCAEDVQAFVVREQRTETTERRRRDGGGWELSDGPTTEVQTYNWTVTDSLVTTDAPRLLGRPGGGLEPPPFGREAPRFVPASALQPDGTVDLHANTAFGPYVTLLSGVGPVRYETTTLFGTAGQAGETWTIAD